MNIWYFTVNPNISLDRRGYAPSIHINETISSLQALGHHVRFFSYGGGLGKMEMKIPKNKKLIGKVGGLIRTVKPLIRDVYELLNNRFYDKSLIDPIFRNNSIDLVYERLFPSKSSVSTCARKYNVPIIVESNAPVEERKNLWGSPLVSLVDREEKKILQNADALIVVSASLKRYYEKAGVAAEKIFVLPNGVNEKRFSPENVSRNIREELGLAGRVVVGFVGHLPYHGVNVPFLSLAKSLNLSGSNIHFLIVGGGPGLDEVKAMVNNGNLNRFFSFAGGVPNSDVPNYIAAMDICLLPHFIWYGSPMKVFEYGTMGKAIIAPNLANIREVLSHGETAYLFESDNFSEVAKAIQELADNESLRTQLGEAARTYMLANHTWTKNAERIIEIHGKIVS